MSTSFEGTTKYPGIASDNARVTHNEKHVLIRAMNRVAVEGMTIIMTPAQARALAHGIIVAADKAEADQ